MKRNFHLLTGFALMLLTIVACQKEAPMPQTDATENIGTSERAPLPIYAVTVYGGPTNPSRLVTLDYSTGAVTNSLVVQVTAGGSTPVQVPDLKGITRVGNDYYLATGPNNPIDFTVNALVRVNLVTGIGSVISYCPFGAFSDICYDPVSNQISCLRNNNNALITISQGASGAFDTYALAGGLTGIANGYTARGLTWSHTTNGDMLSIMTTRTNTFTGDARWYQVQPGGTGSIFLSTILPGADVHAAHCGIGYFNFDDGYLINRTNLSPNGPGANKFFAQPPFPATITSVPWSVDANTFNYEDFATEL